ncbi:hypothetical protein VTP01DRAFT_7796 [Rhizomucor pusillus]|uniref:uncharacterized protein n=1 Tax=Rhizomucor pusillus TaxID=4840 RepID=UPI003743E5B4
METRRQNVMLEADQQAHDSDASMGINVKAFTNGYGTAEGSLKTKKSTRATSSCSGTVKGKTSLIFSAGCMSDYENGTIYLPAWMSQSKEERWMHGLFADKIGSRTCPSPRLAKSRQKTR